MRTTRNIARNGLIGAIAIGLAATMGSAAYAASDRTEDPTTEAPHMDVQKAPDGKIDNCVRIEQTTGTILPRKSCKTAAEWKKEGAHITEKYAGVKKEEWRCGT